MLSFFPLDVLDEILNLIESVSEGFTSYSNHLTTAPLKQNDSKCLMGKGFVTHILHKYGYATAEVRVFQNGSLKRPKIPFLASTAPKDSLCISHVRFFVIFSPNIFSFFFDAHRVPRNNPCD